MATHRTWLTVVYRQRRTSEMFIHAQAVDQKTQRTFGPFKSVTVTACSIQVYEEGDDDERIFAVLNPSGVWESDDGRFTKFEITGA